MLYRYILFIALFGPAIGSAQERKAPKDSVSITLQNHKVRDTIRVNLIIAYLKGNLMANLPPDTLMKYADEALEISQSLKWDKGITMAYQGKGLIYNTLLSDFPNALNCYQKALVANEIAKIPRFTWQTYANIGIIYHDNRLFRKALTYYFMSIEEARKENVPEKQLMQLYGNIGQPYTELNMYDSAIYFYEKAIALQGENTNPISKIVIWSATGYNYMQQGELSKADEYLEKSLALARNKNFTMGIALSLTNLSQLYVKKGESGKAESYAKEALVMTEQFPSAIWKLAAMQTLSNAYEMQAKYKDAYTTLFRSYQVRDSIFNATSDEKLSFLEAQFEFEKKEVLLNATHNAELKQQQTIKYAMAGGASVLLLAGGISFLFYKRRRDALSKQNEAELKAEISDNEMKALRVRMNPHFIFNSLNSISDYISKNKTDLADEYLTKFAKLMRWILESSEQKEVPLIEDLQALELYMQLESRRMNGKFTYEIGTDADIDQENTLIPTLLLQPFIENSIWHGIAKKTGTGKITLHIKKEDDMINCIIEDDGIGRKKAAIIPDNLHQKKSMGLKITYDRINIINKTTVSQATITFTDLGQGTRVEIRLPLKLVF